MDYAEKNRGTLFDDERLIHDENGEAIITIENLAYRFDAAMMGDGYEGGADGLRRVASIMDDMCQAAKLPIEGLAVTDSYNGADNSNLSDYLPDYLIYQIEETARRAIEMYYDNEGC